MGLVFKSTPSTVPFMPQQHQPVTSIKIKASKATSHIVKSKRKVLTPLNRKNLKSAGYRLQK